MSRNDPVVTFQCPQDLVDDLDDLADDLDVDRSQLLRWVAEYAVEGDSDAFDPFSGLRS